MKELCFSKDCYLLRRQKSSELAKGRPTFAEGETHHTPSLGFVQNEPWPFFNEED
jgi:hypothetical protein